MSGTVVNLLNGASTPGPGIWHPNPGVLSTYTALLYGSGDVEAQILIEFSNNGSDVVTGITFNLAGTDSVSDGITPPVPCVAALVRASLVSIAGSGAGACAWLGH